MYSDVNTMATMESCGNDDQLKYNHNVFDLFSPHLTISSCAMGKQRLGPSLVCSQGMQVRVFGAMIRNSELVMSFSKMSRGS